MSPDGDDSARRAHLLVDVRGEPVDVLRVEIAADGIALSANFDGHDIGFRHRRSFALNLHAISIATYDPRFALYRLSPSSCSSMSETRPRIVSRSDAQRGDLGEPGLGFGNPSRAPTRARARGARSPRPRAPDRPSAGRSSRPASSLFLPDDRWVRNRQSGLLRHGTWENLLATYLCTALMRIFQRIQNRFHRRLHFRVGQRPLERAEREAKREADAPFGHALCLDTDRTRAPKRAYPAQPHG